MLVVIDSCHAAGMATSKDGDGIKAEAKLQKALPDFKRVAPSKSLIATLTEGKGRAVFTSAEGEQKSYWFKDDSMSIYTYHFLEALQGAGNKVGNTEVKLSNLMGYLSDTVPNTTLKECNTQQTPYFDLGGNDFAIALLRGGKGLPLQQFLGLKPELTISVKMKIRRPIKMNMLSFYEKHIKPKEELILVLDRTQWQENNILVISVVWKKRALPLYWQLLDGNGASSLREQQSVIRPILKLLKKYQVIVIGEREFHSSELAYWLKSYEKQGVKFALRQKKTTNVQRGRIYRPLKELEIIFLSKRN